MAIIAIVTAGNMCGVFTSGRHTIMTGSAGTQNLRVVDRDRGHKGHGVVAVFANTGCLHMSQTLTDSTDSIVATHAVSHGAGVIENSRKPPNCRMTIVTLITG